ncbi:hypothetical protein PHLGIDRAFT_19566 [Phlebiopsis gigantea 11061_1 CR5-6]|uniref:Endoplasmic reticulum junction formation protein lunapark n=1 Tax=Phlebiopsis gigantea (strain 11061_1 CR5-6) TaxID=745531 RepID=A0A0C3S962_PHLG1|nr:hypothetical protein PHLGIDRAFT_19566 [Phlebiopsis gigantea 11061_1 CR5-6]
MVLFGNWFRKGQPEDYEQVLALLALDIQKRQEQLSEIRLRERRTTLLFSVYALVVWVAYLSLWYTDLVPTLSGHARYSKYEMAVEAAPVFIGPIVILFIRRIAQIWYKRKEHREEKHLVTLRKQQREKVEEIKKKTNYDSTRNLIERYDEGTESPLRRRGPGASTPVTPQKIPTPQPPRIVSPQARQAQALAQIPPALQQQLNISPPRPLPPPQKRWYDKLADVILGDDDTITASSSRYALICQRCFAHNGLVKESVWEETQYACPKCGYFNPSPKALRHGRKGGRASISPSSPSGRPLAPPLGRSVEDEGTPNVAQSAKDRRQGEKVEEAMDVDVVSS